MKKRVLIITYYWPPSGGAGVQRWLKFAKYLPQFNWQPVIYTPENPEMPVIDNSLVGDIPPEAEIIKNRIWEPYEWYKKFAGRKGERINTGFLNEKGKGGISEKVAVWLRGNLFIPDARKFWIKPSVKYLIKYVKENPVDAIISSGPPHSMHVIALKLRKKTGIKWIADFRDPWTNIDYYKDLMLSSYANRKHHKLELDVLQNADAVIAVGPTMAKEFEFVSGRHVHVITNGYDEEDINSGERTPDAKFTLSHVGTLVRSRNPLCLWSALAAMIAEDDLFARDLEIVLAGKVDFNVKQSLKDYKIDHYVKWVDYLPHNEVVKIQRSAQVLLLVLNNTPNAKGILTGKLFEYLAARRPILCIGDINGDAASIIKETNSGLNYDYNDQAGMKEGISKLYNKYKQHNLECDSAGIEKYSRKSLTMEFVRLLDQE